MSVSNNHAEVTAKWRGLPNIKNAASQNYVDQVVLFESIEATDVLACGAVSLAAVLAESEGCL